MKRLLMSLVVACGLWAVGCSDDEVPPPQFNEGVQVGGRTLVPTLVPARKDTSTILGAAASAEEVGAARPASAGETVGAAVNIEVDDSTPEGLMKGFIAIMQSGSMTQLPDLVVPDQQQTIREMVDLVGPMMRAVKALETRWKEKFPDAPFAGVGATPGVGMMPSFGQLEEGLTVSGIETPTDTDAEASLEAPGLNVPLKITMKKIENAWRLEMPNMPAPEMLEQMRPLFNALGGMAAGMARVMEDFAQRIGNNEYASADDARRALDEEMQKSMATVMEDLKKEFEAMGKDMGGEMMKALQEAMAKSVADQPGALPGENAPSSDTLEPAPANNPPPTEPAPAAESPQSDNNRPKSQLEQDMDNAAARSVLGGGI